MTPVDRRPVKPDSATPTPSHKRFSGRGLMLTAIAYYLTGKLGLALAIPPGYATAIWPPAGIALAAVLIGGRKAAIGVFLGSFLVNWLDHVEGGTLSALVHSALVASSAAIVIGAGATLQAVVSAGLANLWRAYPATPPTSSSIARLYIAGGLVGCLINSSIAVGYLTAIGGVAPSNALHSWLIWWAGDAAGVVTITPIVLSFASAPVGQKWRRALSPAAASLIVFALTATLVLTDLRAIDRTQRNEFASLSRELAGRVTATVDLGQHAVEGLAGAFSTDRRPDLVEFRALADRLAAFGLGIQALEWIPRISEADRLSTEQDLSRQWGRPFEISERVDGVTLRAGPRSQYFPVAFATPIDGNGAALGYDLASDAARRAALDKARATGAPVATSGVKLVQNSATGILLIVPVYENAKPTSGAGFDIKGFALGVFSVPDVFGIALGSEFSAELRYWLVDETDIKTRAPLVSNGVDAMPPKSFAGGGLFGARPLLEFTERIKVADRVWALHLAPSKAYLDRRSDSSPYLLLCGGLLMIALANGFVLVVSEQQHELADSRELDLRNQKFALDQHAIVSITDTRGCITYANDLFCAVSGFPRELLLGASHSIVNSGEHPSEYYEDLWSTLRSGKVWRGEICNRSAAGELYWLASTLVPLKDRDGSLKEFIAICTNVTARKRLEQDLEQSHAFLHSITELMGEGVYTIDNQGCCTFLNAEGERLLGWTFAEIRGRSVHDLVHYQNLEGDHLSQDDCSIMHGLRKGRRYQSEDQYFTDRHGRLFPVSIVGERIVGHDGSVGGVIVFQDITARRRFRTC